MIRLLILIFVISLKGYAQTDTLITLKGDKLIGKAIVSSGKNSIQTITLKTETEKKKFKVYEIKSLQIKDDLYRPIKVSAQYQLGLLIKEGYLSWYKYQDTGSSNSFSSSILIKADETRMIVPNLSFKKYMSKFLNDCNVVRDQFANEGYKKSDLAKIVDDYNGCIDTNTDVINSETKIVSNNPGVVNQVNNLIKRIKEDNSLEDVEGVVDMLNDLSFKIKTNAKLPSYLKNALQSSFKNNQLYTNKLNEILAVKKNTTD